MTMTTEDRMRMFENRLGYLEARLSSLRHIAIAHIRAAEESAPGVAKRTFATAKRQHAFEAAENAPGDEGILDAMIDEIDQHLGLPAND